MEEKDYKNQLVNYLMKNVSKGYSPESLKWALINQGYSRISVNRAVERVHQELAKQVPKFKEKPRIKYEILDEQDKPIVIKKSWWSRIFD